MRREISKLATITVLSLSLFTTPSCISSSDISNIIFYDHPNQYSKKSKDKKYTEEEQCAMNQADINPEYVKICKKMPGGYFVLYTKSKYNEQGDLEHEKARTKYIRNCGGCAFVKPHIDIDPSGTIGLEFRGSW